MSHSPKGSQRFVAHRNGAFPMGWPALRHSRAFVPGHMRCLHLAWGVFACSMEVFAPGRGGCLSYRHGCLSFVHRLDVLPTQEHPMLSDSFGHCTCYLWALKALSHIPVLAEALNPQLWVLGSPEGQDYLSKVPMSHPPSW